MRSIAYNKLQIQYSRDLTKKKTKSNLFRFANNKKLILLFARVFEDISQLASPNELYQICLFGSGSFDGTNTRIVSPEKDLLSHEEAQRKSFTLFLLVRVEATFPYNLVTLLYSLVTSVRLEVCCCILKTVQQEICWPTFIWNLWMVVYVKWLFSLILFCFYVLLVIFLTCVL